MNRPPHKFKDSALGRLDNLTVGPNHVAGIHSERGTHADTSNPPPTSFRSSSPIGGFMVDSVMVRGSCSHPSS